MSQRREVEAKLALYDDLSGILGAMRSFALAELRRIGKREINQQQVVTSLSTTLAELMPTSLPTSTTPRQTTLHIWLLFGSVRGFCGSFNEDIVRCWQQQASHQDELILVGERLHEQLPPQAGRLKLNGADGSLDAPAAIDRILNAIGELRAQKPHHSFHLHACIRDESGASCQRIWPLPDNALKPNGPPPLTHQASAEVAAGIADHYLFHQLLALLLRSIRMENHMRLIQMETAIRYLEHGSEELYRQKNRLRQEEIVEEIELMVGRR